MGRPVTGTRRRRWLRWSGYALIALIALGVAGWWWLLVESHEAAPGSHAIDIAEVRRLADSEAGAKPRLIRVETVAHLSVPGAMVVAGDSWGQHVDLPVSSYELVYPDHVMIVDAALDTSIARSMGATFDSAAYARMSGALAQAALIVVTHEHPDHIGGLLAQPGRRELLARTRLTREQVSVIETNLASDAFGATHLPSDIFEGYQPLDYVRYQAVAPGVVLIKAPGHTPGSQMVYVKRDDGVEYLFTGDVAWRMPNIERPREKARLASLISSENRTEVREELAGLRQLHASNPEIHMMPGHDAAAIDAFVKDGLLVQGF